MKKGDIVVAEKSVSFLEHLDIGKSYEVTSVTFEQGRKMYIKTPAGIVSVYTSDFHVLKKAPKQYEIF